MSADRPFFNRFNALIDGGWVARLSGTALRVYLCYLRHMNLEGEAFPSNELLAAEVGQKDPRHVRRARRELVEEYKLLTQVSEGGSHPGDTSRFLVNVPPLMGGGNGPPCEGQDGGRIPPKAKSAREGGRIPPARGGEIRPQKGHIEGAHIITPPYPPQG